MSEVQAEYATAPTRDYAHEVAWSRVGRILGADTMAESETDPAAAATIERAAALADVEARWKAQRVSIIKTLEEWEAKSGNRPEYQSAISDVLAWLNGDMP